MKIVNLDFTKENFEAVCLQLDNIITMGFDYDGYSKAEDLKSLIDEMVDSARAGLQGEKPFYLTISDGIVVLTENGFETVPEEKYTERMKKVVASRNEFRKLVQERKVDKTTKLLDI